MQKKDRRIFVLNQYERKILWIIFVSVAIPVIFVIGFVYSIFGDFIYTYLSSGFADQLLHQFFVISILIMAYYFLFVAIIGYFFVHRLCGSFPRILRDLDDRIAGKSRAHIYLRQGDFAKELVSRINVMIDRLPKS